MGLLQLFLVVALSVCVHGEWRSCGGGTLLKVVVNGKDVKSQIAILEKGTNATLQIDYKSSMASKTSTSKCYGDVSGVKIPFKVNTDGCKTTTPTCPIAANTDHTFTTSIPVESIYPSISLAVIWEEVADNGSDFLFCVVIMAKIQ